MTDTGLMYIFTHTHTAARDSVVTVLELYPTYAKNFAQD